MQIPAHWIDYELTQLQGKPAIEIFDTSNGRTLDYVPLFPSDECSDLEHLARVAFSNWLGEPQQAAQSGKVTAWHIVASAAVCVLAYSLWVFTTWAILGSN